jgi:hypothetical protein
MIALIATAVAAPIPVVPTADEAAALGRGEVVVRPVDATGEIVGLVDIPGADRARVMSAVLDFDLRVKVVSSLEGIEVYAPESDPKGLGAKFRLSILGSTVVYHLRYTIDRDAGWCTFTLDPDLPNDIVGTWGSYAITPIPGGQRLAYRSRVDSGRPVPGFVKNWVATDSTKVQLTAMRQAARP